MAAEWLLDLVECRADMVAHVGGKAANLGELIRLGAPVPGGFVVTTAAHAAGDSPQLRAAIGDAYRAFGRGPVAVRSSATAEDLPGATFAGQQDTYLDVVGAEAVVDAVLRCWQSLWTERAVDYRSRLGIAPDQVSIAVVVQAMVPAEVAGVMFTANMITGARDEYVIDASPGLGEAVVSGTGTPDHYLLDTCGRVREWTPGALGDSAGEPVVAAAALTELCRLGRLVADHFGRPQDIEWAIADGRIWVLQARAMTALPPPPQHLNPLQAKLSTVLSDYLTVRPYPMDMSTWIPYGPAGMMASIVADLGVVGVFDQLFHESDGVVDRASMPLPRLSPAVLLAPVRLARRARQFPIRHWRADPRWSQVDDEVRRLGAADLGSLSWQEVLAVTRTALGLMVPITELRRDRLPATGLALVRLVVLAALTGQLRSVPDLLAGAPTRTGAANDALARVAEVAQANPVTAAAVRAGELSTALDDPDFRSAFQDWSSRYGGRETASPILISPPTLGELPDTVLGLVSVLLGEQQQPRGDHRAALDRLAGHPLLSGWRGRVEQVVFEASEAVAFREDSHVIFSEVMPPLRRALLELGGRLAAAGVLPAAEDVFHCRLPELEALAAPEAGVSDLAAVVADRARRRAELAGVPLLNLAVRAQPLRGDDLLVGIPASRGEATGAVRVINSAEEFGRLAAGEVLVCPYTNPSWTPLFRRAAAVVVDSGGPASHAAIVAREYGIPAVMGTRTGTTTLRDTELVRVDGTAGRVTRPR